VSFPISILGWPSTPGAAILGTPAELFKEPYAEPEGQVEISAQTDQVPVMGEIWEVEALILSTLAEYQVTAYLNIDVRWKNSASEIAKLKENIELNLKQKRENLESVRTAYQTNRATFEADETTRLAEGVAAGVKEGEYNTKASEAIGKKEGEAAQFYETIASRYAATREQRNSEANQFKLEAFNFANLASAINPEIEAVKVEIKEVEVSILRLENEQKVFGRAEILEDLASSNLSLKLRLEFAAAPFYIGAQPPFNKQTVALGVFEQIEVEGQHFAAQAMVVREHFDARVDMSNPAEQLQQQKVIARLQAYVPPHVKPVKIKDFEGAPFITELKLAVSQFTLQCSTTASLART
jgi:hypothetical protein